MKRLVLAWLLLCAIAAVADTSFLKPPAGSSIAIAVWEDMQCPECARAYPTIMEAGKRYNVPVLLFDFPLGPVHPWSGEAALLARYFDTQSKQLGDDFRTYIYQNQPQITPGNLRQYAERFASQHNVALPFAIDPQGQLAGKIQADKALGMRLPVEHTPTIYVVVNTASGTSVREVPDRTQLVTFLEQARHDAVPAKAAPAAAKATPKAGAKKAAAKK